MEDQQPIEELFRESLLHHEEPVNPELWGRISQQLQAPVVDSLPKADPVSTATTTSGWIGSSALQWIAAAVITISAGTGVYFYLTNRAHEPQQKDQPVISAQSSSEVDSETATPLPEGIAITQDEKSTIGNLPAEGKSSDDRVEIESQPDYFNHHITASGSNENPILEGTNTAAQVSVAPNYDPAEPKNSQPAPLIESPAPVNTGILAAQPEAGRAPLKVTFRYHGEADRLQWDFGDGQTLGVLNQTEHTFTEPGVYTVTLKGVNQQQKQVTETLTIRVQADLTISGLPNVLTPNFDGLNDVFAFNSSQFAEIEVNIYDQTGNLVHRFRDTEKGWDGKLANGEEAGEGTYIYIIFARSHEQGKHQQKGLLRLIR